MTPVYVLTGFLGAGKTTLLNALLRRRADRSASGSIALIVNELGDVGIDGNLLPANAARQVELPGGCVCCVLNDELDATILDLLSTRTSTLDAIVIETTGVAEPLPIAWTLEREPLASRVRLAAIVTVVDATNFLPSLPISPSVEAQVRGGDVLILSKAQLVSEAEREQVVAAIGAIAPDVPIRIADPDEAAAWLEELMTDPDASAVSAAAARAGEVTRVHTAHGDEHERARTHGLTSVWVPAEVLVDLEELEDQIAALPAGYVRVKGIVTAVDRRRGHAAEHTAALHRVGGRVSSEPLPRAVETSGRRIVAIGTAVEAGPLLAAVAAATIPTRDTSGGGGSG